MTKKQSIYYHFQSIHTYQRYNIFETKTIWNSHPSFINDPFDCKIPIRYDLLSKEEKKKILYHLKNMHGDSEDLQHEKFERNEQEERQHLEYILTKLQFNFNNRNGIFCLSESYNNKQLWAYYADNYKGYCIGFDIEQIKRYDTFYNFDKVQYSDKFPIIIPSVEDIIGPSTNQFLENLTLFKHSTWSHEKEHRFFAHFESDLDKDDINRGFKLESSAFREVILGTNINSENEIRITESLRKNMPHVKLFKAFPNFDSFEIDLNLIEY